MYSTLGISGKILFMTEKMCTECRISKPLEEFYPDSRRRDGCASKCAECANRIRVEHYEKMDKEELVAWQLRKRQAAREKYRDNKEEILEKQSWQNLFKKYGLTKEQYEALLELQNGVCAICGRAQEDSITLRRLGVDHCHKTGKVRGLLCQRCNSAIGFLSDDHDLLRKAVKYVMQMEIDSMDFNF